MMRAVFFLPLFALLATVAPAQTDTPRERILQGLSMLETAPENPSVLLGIARAYADDGNPVVAAHYVCRALTVDPANPDAAALLDICRTRIFESELRLPANRLIAEHDDPGLWQRMAPPGWEQHGSFFWVASGWVSKLFYHGDTARASAEIGEASLRAGKTGGGHVSLGAVRTGIRLHGAADETQWEGKIKTGFLATDRVLAHAGFTWVDSSTTDPASTWVAGAGAEYFGPIPSKPSVFGFYQHRPDGTDHQLNLALERSNPAGWLKLSVSTQASDPDDSSGTDWSAFPRVEVGARVSPAGSIAIGAGAGRMTHEVRGFHDVLYNQDDAHTHTASIRLSRAFTGGVLEWTSGVDGYESPGGGDYQAVSHVLAVHLNSASHQMPLGASSSWTVSAGARSRGVTLDWSGASPVPLIDRPVAPVQIGSPRAYRAGDGRVLYEDGVILPDYLNPGVRDGRAFFGVNDASQVRPAGPYYQTADFSSRELRYSLRDDLPGFATTWDGNPVGATLSLESPSARLGTFTLSAGFDYSVQEADRRSDDTATQTVLEQESRTIFRLPVSATYWVIHDLDAFNDYWKPFVPPPLPRTSTSVRRGVYSVYEASLRRQLDVTVQDVGFRLVLGRALGPVQARVWGGPALTVTEGVFQEEVAWTERGKTAVLLASSLREHDRDYQLGWAAGLSLRWSPADDSPWFVEASLDHLRASDAVLRSSRSGARLDRDRLGGSISIGIRL